ncbi:ankyrin-1-like [Trichogramma pretiosum]|uniref:ankyrin-1-like n=1 Tax=Trichogramma pretiosum TaxID=7493 RepID=UPI0006C95DA2|nr:ankyrin-1-like [Trichogramma pretiosum]
MFRSACDLVQVDHPKDWSIENERLEYLRRLEASISNCESQPANLLDIFRPEEIECLLSDCVKNILEDRSPYRAFVEFVVRSGYKDVSQFDEDGKPQLRRTTPIHHAAKHSLDLAAVVRELFQVYECDTNYIDETGSTHFHVAVQFGCADVVEKFLELGQDPNIVATGTGNSPLHLAAIFGRRKIAEMLARSRAKTTLVNAEGLTPVAVRRCADPRSESTVLISNFYKRWINESTSVRVFKKFHDDNLSEIASKIIDVQQRDLLRKALRYRNREMAELLLRRGANPNSADARGETALRVVGRIDEDSVKAFFEICDAIGQTVLVDARDNGGHTRRYIRGLEIRTRPSGQAAAEKRRRDPNLASKKGLTPLHEICIRSTCFGFPETLFEIDERAQRFRVRVDALDNLR